MKQFFRSIPRVFRTANKDMRRHFSMIFSSILSIGIALFLVLFMAVMAVTTNRLASNIEGQLSLQVTLSPVLTAEQQQQVGQEIQALEGIDSVVYSSKDQELDKLIAENGQMFARYQDANPLYDIYSVEVSNPEEIEQISTQIAEIGGVSEVTYGGQAILSLVSVFQSLRLIGWLAAIAMTGLCLFLIRNTIQMTVAVREDEISIMRTVGAGSGYILTPFLLEGLSMGFWGALIPAVILDISYPVIYEAVTSAMSSQLLSLYPPLPFLLYLTAADFAFGLLLGLFGAWMAAGKTIRRVR